jgi:hypothetical protein
MMVISAASRSIHLTVLLGLTLGYAEGMHLDQLHMLHHPLILKEMTAHFKLQQTPNPHA